MKSDSNQTHRNSTEKINILKNIRVIYHELLKTQGYVKYTQKMEQRQNSSHPHYSCHPHNFSEISKQLVHIYKMKIKVEFS